MIELRDYQKTAVKELFDRFERMLKSSEQEICVFKAPTGSGKTIVVADLLKKLVKGKKELTLSFVWIAPRKLHDQSKEKLERIYYDQILKCSNFEDLQDNKIDENDFKQQNIVVDKSSLDMLKGSEVDFSEGLIGENPSNIDYIWHKIYRRFGTLGSRGFATTLASGIDMALWDIKGKALNKPVWDLLGGKVREKVPVYSHVGFLDKIESGRFL